MSEAYEYDLARYWSGLAILDRLSETGTGLASEEVAAILGVRSVKGIGSAHSGTRFSLGEAVHRRSTQGYMVWTAGPRIRQARHALEHARRRWMRRERQGLVSIKEAPSEHPGRCSCSARSSREGQCTESDGTMAELYTILEDERFEIEDGGLGSIGEIFIDRIEPSHDACGQPVPEGYGENGIWVRGEYDPAA